VKLKSFQKFDSAATALEEVASLVEGKVTPRLASLLDEVKDEKKVSLAVADPKLGMSIKFLRSRSGSVIDYTIIKAMPLASFLASTFNLLPTHPPLISTVLSVNTSPH
jgi:hypothetical protein